MPSISGTAVVNLSISASGSIGPANTITLSLPTGQAAVTNYPFQFARPFLQGAILHAPQVLVNGTPVTTQSDVKCRYPDGSAKHALVSCVVPSIPQGVSVTLSFIDSTTLDNTPLTQAQMLGTSYNFDAALTVTGTGTGALPQTISARTMLASGFYSLWTSGQVAQTIELVDDSPTRTFDVGFGDGFHPLRPRFYATFWPALNASQIRVVSENYLTSELEDLPYTATISLGASAATQVYTTNLSGTQPTHPKLHWSTTSWTQRFWFGYVEPLVNIDYNVAYLASTRFLPNYDASVVASASGISSLYALWAGKPHDIYDGTWDGGLWQSSMGSAGARGEIGPYPVWSMLWLYSGDWRLRQMALGMSDIAGSFPGQMRESVVGKRLSLTDPSGSSTGFGHVVSITDRKTFLSSVITYSYTVSGDKVTIVGPFNFSKPWSFDGAHQPSAFYPQYLVTGDPWYLQEMYLWAGFSAALYNGAAKTQAYGRGPTGAEGVIDDELRGAGWVIRNRAETAFIAPDADPEKSWLIDLTNDALARWEGSLGITGTPYDGNAIKNWGASTGNYYSSNGGPEGGKAPSLGNWESNGTPNGKSATIVENSTPMASGGGTFAVRSDGSPVVGSFTAPWMQWYVQYAMGRVAELGFAASPLRAHSGAYPVGLINDSGTPQLIGMYQIPVEANAEAIGATGMTVPPGGFFATWPALIAAINPPFLTGVGWDSRGNGGQGDLLTYFTANLSDDGRPMWLAGGIAMMVDAGDSGAAAAWAWFLANVYHMIPLAELSADPKWAIIPRTDTNVLPAIPTTS